MKKTIVVSLFTVLLLGTGCQTPTPNTDACPSGDYCLLPPKKERNVNTPHDYSFAVINDQGQKVKTFDIIHEKVMHVIVIRKDLNEFQHIHPDFDQTSGTFTLKNLNFPTDGTYFLYFDFKPNGAKNNITLREDIFVGESNKNATADLNNTSNVQKVDRFKVTLNPTTILNEIPETKPEQKLVSGTESTLKFQVEAGNIQPIEHVEKYLGEFGHLVIIKDGTYSYIHTHPPAKSLTSMYNTVPFVVNFPQAGVYKMFFEFKYAGKVYSVPYVVNVDEGEARSDQPPVHDVHQ